MSNDAFVPQDYSAPTGGNGKYTKFAAGETRLRILSNPIFGWLYWTTDSKPKRLKQQPQGKPADMRLTGADGREEKIKHFWALKVYNYGTAQMEVLEITQATLQARLTELSRDRDWGHPTKYDIKVNKSGSGKDTEYSVVAVPHQPVSDPIKAAFMATPIDLEQLFAGGDPFAATGATQAPQAPQAPAAPAYQPGMGMTPQAAPQAPAAPAPAPAPAPYQQGADDDLPF